MGTAGMIEAAIGGVGASVVTRAIRKQLAKMQNTEQAERFEKFSGVLPIGLGLAVAEMLPKYKGVGYGMIAYGAADVIGGMIEQSMNGGRYMVGSEYVSGEEINALMRKKRRPMVLSPELRARLAAGSDNGGNDMQKVSLFRPGAGGVVGDIMSKRNKKQPIKRAPILKKHYGIDSDEWDCDNDGF